MNEIKPFGWVHKSSVAEIEEFRDEALAWPVPVFSKKEFNIDVPLYDQSAIDALQAEVERLRKDAERYRRLSGQAFKETAWDRFGDGAYWHIGFYANDSRLSLSEAIDEMKGYV